MAFDSLIGPIKRSMTHHILFYPLIRSTMDWTNPLMQREFDGCLEKIQFMNLLTVGLAPDIPELFS